jgi:exonuclease SbcD
MQFIHAADLHLDSPLRGLNKYEGLPAELIRNTSRAALSNLVDLALAEKVDFVLLSGDIFDGDWRDVSTGMFFVAQMARLNEQHIPVYILRGNHDAASQLTSNLPLPDNVYEFSTERSETFYLHELRVAIHGQGFATRSVKDNLVPFFPAPEPGYFNIGMLHTSLNGREGHDDYAPCSVQELSDKHYDYWALGHIHTREVVCEGDPCWIVFPGNIQGRSIKESGVKGCTLVTVNQTRVEALTHRELDLMRWYAIDVDISGAENDTEVVERVINELTDFGEQQEKALAVRLVLKGVSPLHYQIIAHPSKWVENIRAAIVGRQSNVWLEKIKFQTRPLERALVYENPAIKTVQEVVDNYLADSEQLESLWQELKGVTQNIPLQGFESVFISEDSAERKLGLTAVGDYLHSLLSGEVEEDED